MTADQSLTDRPDHKKKRGELRIYLGAAPGVGKTYAMLGEAHRRLERGTDLVAAVVETHGRKKTAEELEGIEMVPPKYIDYRGKLSIEYFDLPDGGWPLADPEQWARDLAAHVRALA